MRSTNARNRTKGEGGTVNTAASLALILAVGLVTGAAVAAAEPEPAVTPAADGGRDLRELTPLGACVRDLRPGAWTDCGTAPIPLLTKKDNPPPYWGYGSTGVIYGWNGAAFDGRTMYFTGGGHKFYGGNEVYAFDAYTLQWKILSKPGRGLVPIDKDGDGKTDYCRAIYTDGTPNPRHTYDGIVWADGKVYIFGGPTYCTADPGAPEAIWAFDPARGQYEQIPGEKPLPKSYVHVKTAFDPQSGCIFVATRKDIACFRSDTWTHRWRLGRGIMEAMMDVAPDRRLLIVVADVKDAVRVWDIKEDGKLGPAKQIRHSIPARTSRSSRAGLAYDTKRRVFVLWRGGREVIVIDPDDWSVETHVNNEGDGPGPTSALTSRVYSKWGYIESHDVFMGYNDHRQGVWFYRPVDR